MDFVDKNGRAVVITGIPYAPAKDAKIVMKKSFLDQQLRNSNCKSSLTGSQWYNQQASRAVNQAIGRVIRHRFDYGAILLLDTRLVSMSMVLYILYIVYRHTYNICVYILYIYIKVRQSQCQR